ncbi:MAG TPA: TlpA disulfide reductase family protein [Acidobacteriota bacterium]|nr:TlpA disulfide reductase family protein [Acidobacteriota bacterium]
MTTNRNSLSTTPYDSGARRLPLLVAALGLSLALQTSAATSMLRAQDSQDARTLARQAWQAVDDFRRGGGQDQDPEHPGARFGPRLWEVAQSLPEGEDRHKAGEEAVHLMVHAGRFEAIDQWLSGLAASDPIWEAVLNRLPEAGSHLEGNRMATRQLKRLKQAGKDGLAVPISRIDFVLFRLLRTAGYGQEAQALALSLIKEHPDSEAAHTLRGFSQRDGLLQPGDPVPPFKMPTVDDGQLSSDSLRGKVLLVDFWSTTCGICLQEMPTIRAIEERLGEKGFQVMGVAFDQDPQAVLRAVESKKAEWPQVLASESDGLPGKLGASGTPYYVLIDRQGRVAAPGIGIHFVESRVQELLNQSADE